MTAAELKKLSVEELQKKLGDLKEELFNLRFQLAINQLENPMRISAVKKDIARVSTVLRQFELENTKA
ncbi:MAG: 50S ribosomal protein L29 [Clostridia bacterium]|nr:50S ribosomal protein L29 [Clostridia bacterium]